MQTAHLSIQFDPQQTTPVYAQIAQTIRDRIARGELLAGALLPTVRELAQQLKVNQNTVNHAYSLLRREGLLVARSRQGTRVADIGVGEHLRDARDAELRLLAARYIGEAIGRGFALAEVEAAFMGQRARWQEQRTPLAHAAPRTGAAILGLGSHDLCLEVLLAQFQQQYETPRLSFAPIGSLAGLMALARGEAHFATAHLFDPPSADYNLPFVRRLLSGKPCALLTLAQRAQGLLVAKGNPKKIRALRDLTRRGVRFINRQRGSGTRVLCDEMLRQARLAHKTIQGYAREAQTHLAVAAAIAARQADVGLGIQAAARVYELDFVPLAHERFELVLPRNDALIPLLQATMARPEFKQAVVALGGYDLSECGKVRHT